MNDHDTPAEQPVATNREKQRAVDRLRAHYVRDDIDVDQYESMLDRAWGATDLDDLDRLFARLPVISEADTGSDIVARDAAPLAARAGDVQEFGFQVAILSGSDRKGSWVPPRKMSSLALMGGAGLDFREARFGPGVTEVTILAICGGVDVIVPPGITVETHGMGIMGGFDSYSQTVDSDDPLAPVLRIRGLAIMGGVEVRMLLPGETTRDGRRRIREERKHRRLERRSG
jgi:hypothetical protein